MKGGVFQDSDDDARCEHFTVERYKNGAEVWRCGGGIHKVIYNTGDVVFYAYDIDENIKRVSRVITHDGITDKYFARFKQRPVQSRLKLR